MFKIWLGEPGIKKLWEGLTEKKKSLTILKQEDRFFEKWTKAVDLLRHNPRHPGLLYMLK